MSTNFGSLLRKSVPFLYLGGGTITGFAVLYPNTIGLENYRKMVAIHAPNGHEEKVDMEFRVLAEEIADKLNWSEEQRARTGLFASPWLDYVHKGSCDTRWGAAIGVPGHMIPTLDLVDKTVSSGKLGSFTVDFDSPPGRDLLKSIETMTNSVNVKKYSLAKEMCQVDNFYGSEFLIRAGLAGVTIPAAYFTAKFLQVITGFYKNRFLKMSTYAVVFPMFFVSHIILKDAYNCRKQERLDDRIVASLGGPEIARGGAEYYSALLLRNQALLSLCGSQGARNITFYGNVRSSWRRPEPLLTERRDKMLAYASADDGAGNGS